MTIWMVAVSAILIGLVWWTGHLNERIERTNEVLATSLASLSKAVSDLTVTVEDNSNFIIDLRNAEDPVEKQLKEAKQKVMSEYIDGIVNYSPFGKE